MGETLAPRHIFSPRFYNVTRILEIIRLIIPRFEAEDPDGGICCVNRRATMWIALYNSIDSRLYRRDLRRVKSMRLALQPSKMDLPSTRSSGDVASPAVLSLIIKKPTVCKAWMPPLSSGGGMFTIPLSKDACQGAFSAL